MHREIKRWRFDLAEPVWKRPGTPVEFVIREAPVIEDGRNPPP